MKYKLKIQFFAKDSQARTLATAALGKKGGSGASGVIVGTLTNGSSFPTARPDGNPLENGDYVKVKSTSTFPFTIGTITFQNAKDQAFYSDGSWNYDEYVVASINGVELKSNKTSTQLKLDNVPSGETFPAGTYEGQQFIYIGATQEKGLYEFDGTDWNILIKAEGGSDLSEYLKSIEKDETNKTITITDQDDNETTFDYGSSGASENAYETLAPVGDVDNSFEFEANYVELDYQNAKDYFDNEELNVPTGCSVIVKNGVMGRNLDLLYDNRVSFKVRTSAINGRYAVIGQSGLIDGLTNDFVKSKAYSPLYKVVPFYLMDGMNEKGLCCATLVVPNDKGNTTGTLANAKQSINAIMLPRYILDNFATVTEIKNDLQLNTSIYVPQSFRDKGYEVHFVIKDKTSVWCLEFINNACVWVDITSKPIATNYFLSGVTFKSNGKIYEIGELGIADSGLTSRAQGLERYNKLVDYLEEEMTSMPSILADLKYSKLYTIDFGDDARLSEYCGVDGLTILNQRGSFQATYEDGQDAYADRDREDPETSQTIYSAIYDDVSLEIYTQENYSTAYVFHDIPKTIETYDYNTAKGLNVVNNKLEVKVDGETIGFDFQGRLKGLKDTVVVRSYNTTIIDGIDVPNISFEALTDIRDLLLRGALVIIRNNTYEDEFYVASLMNTSMIDDKTTISLVLSYSNEKLLTYKASIEEEVVSIEFVNIGYEEQPDSIELTGESGTITQAQYDLLIANSNVNIKLDGRTYRRQRVSEYDELEYIAVDLSGDDLDEVSRKVVFISEDLSWEYWEDILSMKEPYVELELEDDVEEYTITDDEYSILLDHENAYIKFFSPNQNQQYLRAYYEGVRESGAITTFFKGYDYNPTTGKNEYIYYFRVFEDGDDKKVKVVIEEVGSGGGEPSAYLKSIVKNTSTTTITITDKQGNETSFPYGGGSGTIPSGTTLPTTGSVGDLFILTQDIDDTGYEEITYKGLYRHNGTKFVLIANGRDYIVRIVGQSITVSGHTIPQLTGGEDGTFYAAYLALLTGANVELINYSTTETFISSSFSGRIIDGANNVVITFPFGADKLLTYSTTDFETITPSVVSIGGGSGSGYEPDEDKGLELTEEDKMAVKVDNESIGFNDDGELYFKGEIPVSNQESNIILDFSNVYSEDARIKSYLSFDTTNIEQVSTPEAWDNNGDYRGYIDSNENIEDIIAFPELIEVLEYALEHNLPYHIVWQTTTLMDDYYSGRYKIFKDSNNHIKVRIFVSASTRPIGTQYFSFASIWVHNIRTIQPKVYHTIIFDEYDTGKSEIYIDNVLQQTRAPLRVEEGDHTIRVAAKEGWLIDSFKINGVSQTEDEVELNIEDDIEIRLAMRILDNTINIVGLPNGTVIGEVMNPSHQRIALLEVGGQTTFPLGSYISFDTRGLTLSTFTINDEDYLSSLPQFTYAMVGGTYTIVAIKDEEVNLLIPEYDNTMATLKVDNVIVNDQMLTIDAGYHTFTLEVHDGYKVNLYKLNSESLEIPTDTKLLTLSNNAVDLSLDVAATTFQIEGVDKSTVIGQAYKQITDAPLGSVSGSTNTFTSDIYVMFNFTSIPYDSILIDGSDYTSQAPTFRVDFDGAEEHSIKIRTI